jgi:hypothetical protein
VLRLAARLTAHCMHYAVPADTRSVQEVSILQCCNILLLIMFSLLVNYGNTQCSREKRDITLRRKPRDADQNQNFSWPFNKTESLETMSATLFLLKVYLITFRQLMSNDRLIRMEKGVRSFETLHSLYWTTQRYPTVDHYTVFI